MMALTESLPVGNEAATALVGKTAVLDGSVFAASLEAAGKASGSAAGGKSAGAAAPVKGQQDLAAWVEGQDGPGGETGLGNTVVVGQTGASPENESAVSSIIGRGEILETADGAARGGATAVTGDEDLKDGAGMRQAIWAPGGSGVAAAGNSVDGAGASGKSLRAAGADVASLSGVGKRLAVVEVGGNKAVAAQGVGGTPTDSVAGLGASVGGGSNAEVSGSRPARASNVPVQQPESGDAAVPVGTAAGLMQVEKEQGVGPQTGADRAGAQAQAPNGVVSGAGSKTPVSAGDGAAGTVASSRKEKSGTAGSAVAAAHGGGTGFEDSSTSVAVALASTYSGALASTLPSTLADAHAGVAQHAVPSFGNGVAPGADAVPSAAHASSPDASAPVISAANASASQAGFPGQTALAISTGEGATVGGSDGGPSAPALTVERSAARISGRVEAQFASPLTGTAHAVRGSGVIAGTGVAGLQRSGGAAAKASSGETVRGGAAAPVSLGDGVNALPVTVGIAVAAPLAAAVPLAAAPATSETGAAGIVGIEVAPKAGAKAQGGGGAVSGAAPAKDRDGRAVASAGRSDGTAVAGAGAPPDAYSEAHSGAHLSAHSGVGEPVAGSTGTATRSGVQGLTVEKSATEKSAAEPGKAHDAGQAVSGTASLEGVAASNAHGGAAVGWNGGMTGAAVPVHTPGAGVAVIGPAASAVATANVSGSGAAAGPSSGASTGLVGSGQGHTTLQATPTVLEVGVPGGTHGWLKIRAELGEGGAVQASMSSATQAGQDALRKELPAMSAYLQSEHVPVSLQMAHAAATFAGGTFAGGTFAGGTGSGLTGGDGPGAGSGFGSGSGGQAGGNPEQNRGDGFGGVSSGGSDAGEQGNRRQPGADGELGVTASGMADGVSAAVASAATDWTSPLAYGGLSTRGGGNWVNVIA